MGEIVTAVLAAAVAVVAVAVLVLVARWSAGRSERRFEAALRQLDDHMLTISRSFMRVVERTEDVRERGASDLGLVLDLHELLERLVDEAATRTGAHAAAVRVSGPGGSPAAVALGMDDAPLLLETTLSPPGSPPYRALTMSWSYGPALGGELDGFRSGLIVPIVEEGAETGALAVFGRASGAFGPEHARTLESLAAQVAPGLGNARRFAEAELRALTDALTGVRNRRGYDDELEREVSRARRTGRPLSLVLLDLDDFSEVNKRFDYPGGDQVLREFAEVLKHAARATDTVCRRGGEEFAILLSETSGDEGRQLYARLRETVAATSFSHIGRMTFSAGLVEWRPNESSESLDARASAAVNRAKRSGKDRLEADWP